VDELPDCLTHFISSGLVALLLFYVMETMSGAYSDYRHRNGLISVDGKPEHSTHHYYSSLLVALLGSVLLHLALDRWTLDPIWSYAMRELRGEFHPWSSPLILMTIIVLMIGIWYTKGTERNE